MEVRRATELTAEEFYEWYTSLFGVPRDSFDVAKMVALREKLRPKQESQESTE